MKKHLLLFIICAVVLASLIWLAPCTQAGLLDEIPSDQRKSLDAGETIVLSENLPDKAWPRLKLYRLVNAPPDSLHALLLDVKSAPSYTPGMVNVEIVGAPSENVKDIQYTVKFPVLSNITYTVRNFYDHQPGLFSVRWELLKSPIASDSKGSLRVEPYGTKSLLSYTNHVTPSVPMIGVLKSQAAKEAKSTIEAIAKEAERRAAQEPK